MPWNAIVEQDGRTITVNPGPRPYLGEVGKDNISFDARFSVSYSTASRADFEVTYRVTDQPGSYSVEFTHTVFLVGVPCVAKYGGSVQRQ